MTSTTEATQPKTVRDLRIERGITQEQLAIELGTSPGVVIYWEKKARRPGSRFLPLLCKYFGVTVEQLDLAPNKVLGPPIGHPFRRSIQ